MDLVTMPAAAVAFGVAELAAALTGGQGPPLIAVGSSVVAGEHETLQSKALTVTGGGERLMVNGKASVVCGNVQTANATVYLIDGVLLPPSS